MKKAIFGGTFDPIHKGHVFIAEKALKLLNLDKVIFVPCGNPPHKIGKKITDGETRFKMVEEAVKDEDKFEVSRIELENKGLSYTYKTLEIFNGMEKNTEWYFIIGADSLMEFYTWKNTRRITELCTLIAFYRPGFNIEDIKEQKEKLEKETNKKIIFLDSNYDVSSTNIRNKIKNGKSVEDVLNKEVYNIIKNKGLYKEE